MEDSPRERGQANSTGANPLTQQLDRTGGWEVRRLSHLMYCLDGRRVPLNAEERGAIPGDVPYWGANGVVDYVGRWLLNEPLVLLGEDGAPFFDKTKPVAFHVTGKIWPNNHIHVLRPLGWVSGPFLTYALNAVDYGDFIDGSTRDKLTQGALRSIKIPLPGYKRQTQIASFLDRKTAAIDDLIAKKQRLIELLQEKRQALITQAVTKGLDPSVPLKDSGVEWIGRIPSHWHLRRMKYISPGQCVGVVVNPSAYYAADGIPFLFGGNVIPGGFKLESVRYISGESSRLLRKSMLRAGDLVTVRVGYPGVTAVIPPALDGSNCASMMIVRRADTFCSEWLAYAMNSQVGRSQVEMVQYGAAQEQFNVGDAVNFTFPFPPLREQEMIAGWLSKQLDRFAAVEARAQQQVGLLGEYRQALITAAVTGKLDIPGAPEGDVDGQAQRMGI
jgi:type I restriction enzyme S subunit